MAIFPTDFTAQTLVRSSNILVDNGTANGLATPAAVLGLLTKNDLATPLLGVSGVTEDVASTVTAYPVVVGDQNKTKRFLASSACTVTVPAGMVAGFVMGWKQWGAGVLTFASVSGAGQTIRSTDGLRSGAQYASGTLEYLGSNEWHLVGYTQV